jgi:hexokinase
LLKRGMTVLLSFPFFFIFLKDNTVSALSALCVTNDIYGVYIVTVYFSTKSFYNLILITGTMNHD